jgi:hypothetical protein
LGDATGDALRIHQLAYLKLKQLEWHMPSWLAKQSKIAYLFAHKMVRGFFIFKYYPLVLMGAAKRTKPDNKGNIGKTQFVPHPYVVAIECKWSIIRVSFNLRVPK